MCCSSTRMHIWLYVESVHALVIVLLFPYGYKGEIFEFDFVKPLDAHILRVYHLPE